MKELEYPFDAEYILSKKKKLRRQLLESGAAFIDKKVAILGGSTTSDVKLILELFLLNYGIRPSFYESEYNQYYQDAMFPNAKQESLFIGMIHGFRYMGVPQYVLTDNMKSVVIRRDLDGQPVWQKDYEQFMRTVGFQTKLCKPRHPFTKGKVERLVRFVKDNFLAGRIFWNVTDLNLSVWDWCEEQNTRFHRGLGIPQDIHRERCAGVVSVLNDSPDLLFYLCPERRISFDGFVSYEGRRFGVPYRYSGKTARVMRDGSCLYIYSADMTQLLATHEVTWGYRDSYCQDQYVFPEQPEEFPSMPVKTVIKQLPKPPADLSFEKFNFTREDDEDD